MTGAVVHTTCAYCGVGCGIKARFDGKTTNIEGDENHPANFGRLCSKGSALGETLSLDGRLLHPEVGGEQTDWGQALDAVAEGFANTIATHGPNSVALYVSGQILTEDYYVANKLMKGCVGSANIDTNSRLCMASSVAGHRKAFGTDTVPGLYEDLELADLVVLTGSNLAWCHPVTYQRLAAAKINRPHMKVVLIDPRRTMTAEIADLHLPIAPDGDTALFVGLLARLHPAQDYINKHTAGFADALREARAMPMEEIVAQTGLTSAQLNAFWDLWVGTEKVVTLYSQGVNQSRVGTDKVSAIINCHLATGRIGKPGMGPFSITGQPNAMGGREVGGLANMLAAHMNIENPTHRDIVQRFWGSPTMAAEQGLKAVELFEAIHAGDVKAVWIMATNPVDSVANADFVQEALKRCELVVVSDVLTDTDTIRHAHIKLPAAGWGEKDGTVTNSERRISRQRGFLPLPGQAKPDWWIVTEVARRMGFADQFPYDHAHEIFAEFAALSAFENDGSRDFDIGAFAEIDAEEYDTLDPFLWPKPDCGVGNGGTRFFANGGFYHPDGKARFVPVKASALAHSAEDGWMTLNTGRVRDHWHTMTRTAQTARLSAHLAEPFVELHPSDAARLGIDHADLVHVSNRLGDVTARALITDRQAKGAVFLPMHWTDQFASQARVDVLVPSDRDPFSGQPAFKNVAVKVEKAHFASYGFLISVDKPDLCGFDYWAIARCADGWRTEFATKSSFVSTRSDDLFFEDHKAGRYRACTFDGDQLSAAIYVDCKPVRAARNWIVSQLGRAFEPSQRFRLMAGLAGADQPDPGAIICACHAVGINQIKASAAAGNNSVSLIGEDLSAGSNCGPCRSEIAAILRS